MKPQHVIALVVVAVLATIAIEESRIAKLRAEIIRLQAIPPDEPSDIEAIVASDRSDEPVAEEPSPAPVKVKPAVTLEPETSTPAGRRIPDDFPDPDETTIKQLALSPYSDFAYEIGLNNHERAYLEALLEKRASTLQQSAAKWIEADPMKRADHEEAMTLIIAHSDDEIARFLGNEPDAKAFASYHAMQPERALVATMAAALDSAGATLEMAKEKQLIEALHQARVGTGSLDWNSPAGLKATSEKGALERFESEWTQQSTALEGLLPKFLSDEETEAVMNSRESLKPEMQASIEAAIQAIRGEDG